MPVDTDVGNGTAMSYETAAMWAAVLEGTTHRMPKAGVWYVEAGLQLVTAKACFRHALLIVLQEAVLS